MAAISPPRVLVVDDEPVVRDVLTRYLTHEGFEVIPPQTDTLRSAPSRRARQA